MYGPGYQKWRAVIFLAPFGQESASETFRTQNIDNYGVPGHRPPALPYTFQQ